MLIVQGERFDAYAMEELTMMLIYLSHFTEQDRFANKDDKYAWKGYNFDVLNKLDEKDYIRQGSHRAKSMYITKEGEVKAKELLEKYNVADWQNIINRNASYRYVEVNDADSNSPANGWRYRLE